MANMAVADPPGLLMYREMSRSGSSAVRCSSWADDQVGDVVVDRAAQHHDAVLEQPGVEVEGPLAPVGLLEDGRDQIAEVRTCNH